MSIRLSVPLPADSIAGARYAVRTPGRAVAIPASRRWFLLFLLLWVSWIEVCTRIFPESSFNLSSDSRLPRWFTLPEGVSRAEVSAGLDIYSNGSYKIRLIRPGGEVLAEVNIPAEDTVSIEGYDLMTAHGTQEVIQFYGVGTFRVVDDPALLKQLERMFAAKKRGSAGR